jgi:hypothetical protein
VQAPKGPLSSCRLALMHSSCQLHSRRAPCSHINCVRRNAIIVIGIDCCFHARHDAVSCTHLLPCHRIGVLRRERERLLISLGIVAKYRVHCEMCEFVFSSPRSGAALFSVEARKVVVAAAERFDEIRCELALILCA